MTPNHAPLPRTKQGRFSGRFQPRKGMTAALDAGRLPWGGAKAKRSPKEQSAAPGRVTMLPKVVLDVPGLSRHRSGPRRRPGSGQQDRSGHGTSLGAWPGLVVLCPDNSPLLPAISTG